MKYIKEGRELKSVKRYVVVIILLMSSLILSSAIPVNYTGSNNLSNTIDNSLNQIQPPSNVIDNNLTDNSTAGPAADSDYGKLRDGSNYYYSDVNKIDGYRNGTLDSDVSFNTVSASSEHGSASNPYVISTVAQWNAFAADTANATNANKVFVLGADLDFAGETFTPVNQLNAKFYGQNFALKNITHAFPGNSSGIYGVFGTIIQTQVTDLGLDNVNFTNMGYANGSIAGKCDRSSVLNCHFKGSLERHVTTSGAITGGIVGLVSGNSDSYFYRCSSLVNFILTTNSSNGHLSAGIFASVTGGVRTHILDCITINDVDVTIGATDLWHGGVASYGGTVTTGTADKVGNQEIENAIAYTDYHTSQTASGSKDDTPGSILSGWNNAGVNINLKNTYGSGEVTSGRDIKNSMYPAVYWKMPVAMVNLTSTNSNWFADKTCYNHMVAAVELFANKGISTTKYDGTGAKTQAAMYDKAVSEMPDNIWMNKSVISEDYMTNTDVTNTDGYTIYNSPVRNPLVIRVSYYNLTSSGEELMISGGEDNWFVVDSGEALQDPRTTGYNIKPNHVFLGWTPDKTGASSPINTVTGLLGDVKLYACWGIENLTVTATSDKAKEVYGNGNITISSSAQSTGIASQPNWNITYKWHKKGSSTTVGTGNKYIVENVKQSGTYLFDYIIYDPAEPLWRATGSSTEANAEITPAPLTVKELNIGSGEHAFVGMTFNQIHAMPVMIDGKGNTVTGTAAWGTHAYDRIKDSDIDGDGELDGKIKQSFTFTPDESYEGNYESGKEYEGTIDVEYLTISFVLPPEFGKTITERLEYNQLYTYKNVAELFDSAFKKDLGESAMPDGFVPYLEVNGVSYKIDALKKNSNTAYDGVTDNISIKVEFKAGTFKVTFDKNLDGDNDITTDTSGVEVKAGLTYGRRVGKPADPTNGSKMFLGWYLMDGDGNISATPWDFDVDVVTDDIILYAQWLEPSELLSITVKAKSGAKFIAREALDIKQIVVTATFKCVMPDGTEKEITTDVLIDTNNISFTYVGTGDGKLHVDKNGDGTTTVKVRYTTNIGGVSKFADFDFIITVEPILLNTDGWTFNDKTFTYDGTAKKIEGFGSLDSNIKKVVYSYLDSDGNPIDAADVIGIGVYTVIASFETSADYKAADRTAELKIVAQSIEVSVTWDKTSFVYNGLQQYPKPTFTTADGAELPLDYEALGIDDAINAGNYTITIKLLTDGYSLKDGEDSTAFNITKAVLPVPTLKEGDIIYAGANIDLTDPSNLRLDGFDPNIMEIVSGGTGFNAGNYTVIIKFKSSAAANCSWQSGSSTVSVKWEIKKATAIADWGNNYKFLWDGSAKRPSLVGIIDVFEIDKNAIDLSVLIYEGDVNASEIGSYTVSVRVPASAEWVKNYNLENTSFDFVIVPDENVEIIDVIWENLVFTYNGDLQAPVYKVVDMDGNEVSADVLESILFEIPASKYAGDYTAKATVKAGANYFIRSGGAQAYKINLNAQGEGADPNGGSGNNEPGGNAFIDFFKKLIENNFPLWQVATSGVALLLTLIFMIKAIQYGNRKKKAKGEAKKYNAKIYAALLPIFSTQTVWLNLSNMIWSIIAFSLCGVMLLMFITMLITRKGWKKAELAKETAIEESEQRKVEAEKQERREFQERMTQVSSQGALVSDNSSLIEEMHREMEERRRADEERHREEMAALREEQAKRDEAMKIMLANMMGRQQSDGNMGYAAMDDTDLLVQKVIAGLLPAVQQMIPEAPAYLAAPSEKNDELISLVEQQNEEMKAMSAEMQRQYSKIDELQEQLSYMAQERCDAVLLPETAVAADQSEEIKNLNAQMLSMQQKIDMMSAMSVDELDDDDLDDDEEEWDSILDEDDDDFVEAVIIEEDGTVKKTYPNFRMRLKQSSDKNREWYASVKNLFCSQKGVTYRVYKRVEKIRYQGQVIAVIGIAKRSIKLWLALKPYEYDARRYHHKDVSDKPRFVDVPMYVRVSSDRALTRAQELILALFQELNMEARKRYNDRSIQELIFTLKHNKLLTNKQNKGLLCEVMHVHDCDVLSDELAEKCIESKNVEIIDESYIETLKLDDIDAKFQDGNRVTLEKLKKVGLVSEECTGYTVTAGQRLTKPLIIVANDFTLPAVKMITLTGGRAIKLKKV